jgi:hypothetical protein
MTNLPFAPTLSSMALVSLLNSGQQLSSTQSTFTIGWSMPTPKSSLSKVFLAQNPISPTKMCFAHGCASNVVVKGAESLIAMTSLVSSLALRLPIKTYPTSIWSQEL